jgi:hypothetical protein
MLTCATGVLATRAIGPILFWVVVFILGMTNTFYFLLVEAKEGYTVTFLEFATGILFCLSGGGLGICLWKISEYAFPEWNVTKGWLNMLIALTFVGSLMTFLALLLAFLQELAQRSYFMEEALWGAIGKGLTARFLRVKGRNPIIVHSSNKDKQASGKKAEIQPREEAIEAETAIEVPEEWPRRGNPRWKPHYHSQEEEPVDIEDEMERMEDEVYEERDLHAADVADIREFLVIGSKKGGPGFGRAAWNGIELSSGTVVTERMARKWTDMFREAGHMEVIDGKTALVASLNEALRSVT